MANYEGRIKFEYYHNLNGNSYNGMTENSNQKFIQYCKEYYPAFAEKAESVGFDGFMDMYLSIDINAKGFQDVKQNINWSDDEDSLITQWLSEEEL